MLSLHTDTHHPVPTVHDSAVVGQLIPTALNGVPAKFNVRNNLINPSTSANFSPALYICIRRPPYSDRLFQGPPLYQQNMSKNPSLRFFSDACWQGTCMAFVCEGRATSGTAARSPPDHPSAPWSARICFGWTGQSEGGQLRFLTPKKPLLPVHFL